MDRRGLLASLGAASAIGGCSRLDPGREPLPTGTATDSGASSTATDAEGTPAAAADSPEATDGSAEGGQESPDDADETPEDADETPEGADETPEGAGAAAGWTYGTGGWIDGFADGTVFCREHWFGDGEGRVVALDAATGDPRWGYGSADGQEMYSGLTVADAVYFGRRDGVVNGGAGEVYALEFDGAERWTHRDASSLDRRPVLEEGVLYAAGDAGEVRAFDAADGTVRWENDDLPSAASMDNGVLAVDDVVFVKLTGVFGLDPDDGAVRWRHGDDDSGGGPRVVARDGVAYVHGRRDGVVALESDGTERWRADLEAVDLRVTTDRVVVQTGGDRWTLHGLETASGTERWRIDDREYGLAAGDEDRVYAVAREGGGLYSFDAAGGTEVWGDPLDGTPIAAVWTVDGGEGSVFVETDEADLHRVSPGGEVTWSESFDGYLLTVDLREDLYVGTSQRLHRLPLP